MGLTLSVCPTKNFKSVIVFPDSIKRAAWTSFLLVTQWAAWSEIFCVICTAFADANRSCRRVRHGSRFHHILRVDAFQPGLSWESRWRLFNEKKRKIGFYKDRLLILFRCVD